MEKSVWPRLMRMLPGRVRNGIITLLFLMVLLLQHLFMWLPAAVNLFVSINVISAPKFDGSVSTRGSLSCALVNVVPLEVAT